MADPADLTLVIDIGKSHAKLLLIDAAGTAIETHVRHNASVTSPLGYPALDLEGLQAWAASTLKSSPHAAACRRVIASTHGAALVALDDSGAVAWAPLDYEFDALPAGSPLAQAFDSAADPFEDSLSPPLPAGLNAARQLFYVQHTHPTAWQRTRCLLPYAQYWAWLLCGEAASEVSSLGCHTYLWRPAQGNFSASAHSQGWADLFAPLRPAWAALGCVKPAVAEAWGLPTDCVVHVGVHDSNACLASHMAAIPSTDDLLTCVSSGTWTVLMAPGAPVTQLDAARDMLANVDVIGRATPTARFMGGREYAALLEDANPAAASQADVQALIDAELLAMPCFAPQGGPFIGQSGQVLRAGQALPLPLAQTLSPGMRAALAALYCAQVSAWLIAYLWRGVEGQHTVVVDGPLAHNALYLGLLQALLQAERPGSRCLANEESLEGTARGAWLLSRWEKMDKRKMHGTPGQASSALKPQPALALHGLASYHAAWLAQLDQKR